MSGTSWHLDLHLQRQEVDDGGAVTWWTVARATGAESDDAAFIGATLRALADRVDPPKPVRPVTRGAGTPSGTARRGADGEWVQA